MPDTALELVAFHRASGLRQDGFLKAITTLRVLLHLIGVGVPYTRLVAAPQDIALAMLRAGFCSLYECYFSLSLQAGRGIVKRSGPEEGF
ncbi:hypothetical protein ES708_08480 [subsurface metagenome]